MGKFTSVIRTAPGNEERTKTPTACCGNTCRREPTFPVTRNPNWTRSRCVSINAREKLWDSRLQQVNCAQVLRRPSELARLTRHWPTCPNLAHPPTPTSEDTRAFAGENHRG